MRAKPKTLVNAVARRGDLFVQTVEHRYTLLHDKTQRRIGYPLAVVTSVSREGRVTAYHAAGENFIHKSTPQGSIHLVSAARADVSALEAAYVARGEPHVRDFKSLEEARDFIRPYFRSSDASLAAGGPAPTPPPGVQP